MSRQIHIWDFKSICRKMTKKSPENEISAKGNNSWRSRSNATKVKLDLYYVKTNPYTKFQVNISKVDWEKFGKPSGRTPSGLTDWRTEGQTDGQTDGQTARKPIYLSKHVREKCGKLCISTILSSKRGITPTKIDGNWRHLNLVCSTVKHSHMQNFSSICQSM